MTDRPIIFSGPMIQALLAGRKTMTRRLAFTSRRLTEETKPGGYRSRSKILSSPWQKVKVGDRLWVRENFAYVGSSDPGFLTYQATYPSDLAAYGMENVPATLKEAGYKWTPCIHMPRAVSRLTLILTATKIERLFDISDDDIRAEGIVETETSWLNAWRQLWESIHGPDDWKRNPEVVALSFRVIKSNIDQVRA